MPGPTPKRDSQRRRRNKPAGGPSTTVAASGEVRVRDGEPPRTGQGSGIAAWRKYAAQEGVEVPEGASRADIITLVDGRSDGVDGGWHPVAAEWYRSLADSAQSHFYEPSDWATAKVLAAVLSRAMHGIVEGTRGTGTLLERWQIGATELLTTEGARRRARVEIQRATGSGEGEEAPDVSDLDIYRRRRGAS